MARTDALGLLDDSERYDTLKDKAVSLSKIKQVTTNQYILINSFFIQPIFSSNEKSIKNNEY